jgi:hypothetical protein
MIKKRLSRYDWLLLIANLIPVYGVWFLGWHPTEAFIVYAMETMIAGAFTVLKLLVTTIIRKKDEWPANGAVTQQSGWFFIFFFIVHYGFFTLVQTTIFSQSANLNPAGSGMFYFVIHWQDFLTKNIAYSLLALFPLFKKEIIKPPLCCLLCFSPMEEFLFSNLPLFLAVCFLHLVLARLLS